MALFKDHFGGRGDALETYRSELAHVLIDPAVPGPGWGARRHDAGVPVRSSKLRRAGDAVAQP